MPPGIELETFHILVILSMIPVSFLASSTTAKQTSSSVGELLLPVAFPFPELIDMAAASAVHPPAEGIFISV
jgi:hypothetical protein